MFDFEKMDVFTGNVFFVDICCDCKKETINSFFITIEKGHCINGALLSNIVKDDLVNVVYIDYDIDHIKITKIANERCRYCQDEAKRRPDTLFQNSIWSHGFATGFSGKVMVVDVLHRLTDVKKNFGRRNYKICCSWKTQPIGGMGIYVKGDVSLVSNKDLWSYIDDDGERRFDEDYNDKFIITKRDQLDLRRDHIESFVIPTKIVGIWIKRWLYDSSSDYRRVADNLKNAGYKVFIVNGRKTRKKFK